MPPRSRCRRRSRTIASCNEASARSSRPSSRSLLVQSEHDSIERQSFLELTRSIAGLPLDQAAAALETSASIAAISLRAGIEFLRAAPSAAQMLQAAELRAWGEMGRRLAMSDYETAVSFFIAGLEELASVPRDLYAGIFTVCTRQMTLSTSIARETLYSLPQTIAEISDLDTVAPIIE